MTWTVPHAARGRPRCLFVAGTGSVSRIAATVEAGYVERAEGFVVHAAGLPIEQRMTSEQLHSIFTWMSEALADVVTAPRGSEAPARWSGFAPTSPAPEYLRPPFAAETQTVAVDLCYPVPAIVAPCKNTRLDKKVGLGHIQPHLSQ